MCVRFGHVCHVVPFQFYEECVMSFKHTSLEVLRILQNERYFFVRSGALLKRLIGSISLVMGTCGNQMMNLGS